MFWIGAIVGVVIIGLAFYVFKDAAGRVRSLLADQGVRQLLWIVAAGSAVTFASVAGIVLTNYIWFRAPHAKIAMPARVLRAIDEAIDTGVLPRGRAGDVNEWLNFDVRIQPREIEVVKIEHRVAVPIETLNRVAARRSTDATDKDVLVKFVADAALDRDNGFYPGELKALQSVLTTGTVTESDAQSLKELARHAGYSYGLSPMDFGIPESHSPDLRDHGPPAPPVSAGEVAPVPPPAP